MQRYNFDRYKDNQLMAEGIAVHAKTFDDAITQATELLVHNKSKRDLILRTERLEFRNNRQCLTQCKYCKKEAIEECAANR